MSDICFVDVPFDCCCGCSIGNTSHSGLYCRTSSNPVVSEQCLVRGLNFEDTYNCKRCLDLQTNSQDSSSFLDSSPPLSQGVRSPQGDNSGARLQKKRKNASLDVFSEKHDRAIFGFMDKEEEITCPLDEFFSLVCKDRLLVTEMRYKQLVKNVMGFICVLAYMGDHGVSTKKEMHTKTKYSSLVNEYNEVVANLPADTKYELLFDCFAKHFPSLRGAKTWPPFVSTYKKTKLSEIKDLTSGFKLKCGFDADATLNEDEKTVLYCYKFGEHIENLAKEMIKEINGDLNVNWINSADLPSGYTVGCKYFTILIF